MPLGAFKLNSIARYIATTAASVRSYLARISSDYGSPNLKTSSGKFNGYLDFDPDESAFMTTYPADSSWYLDMNKAWTVEFWMYITQSAATTSYIPIWRVSDTNTGLSLVTNNGTNRGFRFYVDNALKTAFTLSDSTWTHIAIVSNGSNNLKTFVDGVQKDSVTTSRADNKQQFYFGYEGNSAGLTNVRFDEIRVSNVARYTSGFTPPTSAFTNDANTIALMHVDGNSYDDITGFTVSRVANTISAMGDAKIKTAQSKFGGSSAYFDGTGDYLRTPFNFDWAGTPATYEFWIYADTNAQNPGLISFYSGTNSGFVLGWAEYDDTIKWLGSSTGTANPSARASTGTVTKNTWNHVAFVVNNGNVTAYLNGTQGSTGTYVPAPVVSGTYLKIASGTGISSTWSGTNYLVGYMDEIRISNIARYSGNFTPPTSAFTNDANTLLLIHANGSDNSTTFTDDNS